MDQDQKHRRKVDSIKYGDVFDIYGQLAAKPIAPQDAAALESAENLVLGEIPEGALSSLMKSAAEVNQRRGFVRHDEMTDIVREEGPTISETTVVGHRIISESIGGQFLGRFAQTAEMNMGGGDNDESAARYAGTRG